MGCEHLFDQMTKALTSVRSRRDTLKWIGAGTVGTLLMTLGVREAEAAPCTAGPRCSGQLACPGVDCHCTHCVFNTPTPRSFCWQNQFCSTTPPCTNSLTCIFTKGFNYRCVETCCTGLAHCFPKCGTVPPIGPGALTGGPTGAHL